MADTELIRSCILGCSIGAALAGALDREHTVDPAAYFKTMLEQLFRHGGRFEDAGEAFYKAQAEPKGLSEQLLQGVFVGLFADAVDRFDAKPVCKAVSQTTMAMCPSAASAALACSIAYMVDRDRSEPANGLWTVAHILPMLFEDSNDVQEVGELSRQAFYLGQSKMSEREAIAQLGDGVCANSVFAIAAYCVTRHITDMRQAIVTAITYAGNKTAAGIATGALFGAQREKKTIPQELMEIVSDQAAIEQLGEELENHCLIQNGTLLCCTDRGQTVTLRQKITRIAPGAFQKAAQLRRIELPIQLLEIGADAFPAGTALQIVGHAGSVAQLYAQRNKLAFLTPAQSRSQKHGADSDLIWAEKLEAETAWKILERYMQTELWPNNSTDAVLQHTIALLSRNWMWLSPKQLNQAAEYLIDQLETAPTHGFMWHSYQYILNKLAWYGGSDRAIAECFFRRYTNSYGIDPEQMIVARELIPNTCRYAVTLAQQEKFWRARAVLDCMWKLSCKVDRSMFEQEPALYQELARWALAFSGAFKPEIRRALFANCVDHWDMEELQNI